MPMFEAGYSADIKSVLDYLELKHEDKSATEWTVIMPSEEKDMALENRLFKEGLVPNVKGMGIRDAIFVLENMGMSVKINGFGKVKSQSVKPGTKLNGQKIMIFLG